MFLNGYPYTDFHEMNLDFLLKSMETLKQAFADFTASNSLIFAEPLLHNITSTYAKNTIVLDPDGNAYISLQNVPSGVQLSNSEYWLMVFNFEDYTEKANKNFTVNYFRDTTRAPYALSVGDWCVLDDVLYTVTQTIAADDLFEVGTNLTHFTVEQFLKDFVTSVNQTLTNWYNQMTGTINQYKNDIDASELAYRNQLAEDIANTTASLQSQLNQAISGATVDSEVILARVGWNGTTYATLGEAITTQITDDRARLDKLTPSIAHNLIKSTELGDITTSGVPVASTTTLRTNTFQVTAGNKYMMLIKGRSDGLPNVGMIYWYTNTAFISYEALQPYTFKTAPATATRACIVYGTWYGTTDLEDVAFIEQNALDNYIDFDNSRSLYLGDNIFTPFELGDINSSGTPVSSSTTLRSSEFIEINDSDSFIIECYNYPIVPIGYLYFYTQEHAFISLSQALIGTAFTPPTNAKYCKIVLFTSYGTTYNNDVQMYHIGGSGAEIAAIKKYPELMGSRCLEFKYELGDFDSQGQPAASTTTIRSANFVSVRANQKYYIVKSCFLLSYGYMYFYDSSKTFISYVQIPRDGSPLTSPAGSAFAKIALSSAYGTTFNHDLMILEPFRGTYLNDQYYVVAQDGSGDFTSLTDASAAVPDGSTIFVKSGLYQNEEIACMTKTLYIIGEDTASTIIQNTTGDYSLPPIEIGAGLLKNLTIDEAAPMSDGRGAYAVHHDTDYSAGKTFTIENCVLKSQANSALGMGMRGGEEVVLKNSEFYSETGYGLFANDALEEQIVGDISLKVINCVFYSNTANHEVMHLCSWRSVGNRTDCLFIGNVLKNVNGQSNNWYENMTDPRAGSETVVGNFNNMIGWYNSVLSCNNTNATLDYST